MLLASPAEQVCLRCLARESQRINLLISQRSISNSRAAHAQKRPEKNRPPNQRFLELQSENAIKVKGWRSFIKSKYLGQPASILVLRDAETKRGVHRKDKNGEVQQTKETERPEPEVHEQELKSLEVHDLLASIEASKKVPGQAEVNKSIEKLRPRPVVHGEEVSILQKDFDALVNKLDESFNQAQISRYIALQDGLRTWTGQKLRRHGGTANGTQGRSDWLPVDPKGIVDPHFTQLGVGKRSKGKRAYVEYILQRLWDIQIVEEAAQLGLIDLRVESPQVRVLSLGAESSPLSMLSRKYEVKIDVVIRDSLVRITATKQRAKEAADAFEAMVRGMTSMAVDLTAIGYRKSASSAALIRDICTKAGCGVHIAKYANDILAIVRAITQARAENCRRAIYSHAPAVLTSNRRLLIARGPNADSREMKVAPEDPRSLPTPLPAAKKGLGRLFYSSSITPSWSSESTSKPDPVSRDEFQKAIIFLRTPSQNMPRDLDRLSLPQGDSSQPQIALDVTASFGSIQCATSKPFTTPASIDQATINQIKLIQRPPYILAPSNIGLIHFLRSQLSTQKPRDQSMIRVDLVPSPWQHRVKTSSEPPSISLAFDIDQAARRVKWHDITITHHQRKTGIVLPALATGVELTGLVQSKSTVPVADRALGAFIQDLENSGSGYARVQAHPFVILPPSIEKIHKEGGVSDPSESDNSGTSSPYSSQSRPEPTSVLNHSLDDLDRGTTPRPERSTDPPSTSTSPPAAESIEYFTTSVSLVQQLTFTLPSSGLELIYTHRSGGEYHGRDAELMLRMTDHTSPNSTPPRPSQDGGASEKAKTERAGKTGKKSNTPLETEEKERKERYEMFRQEVNRIVKILDEGAEVESRRIRRQRLQMKSRGSGSRIVKLDGVNDSVAENADSTGSVEDRGNDPDQGSMLRAAG